MPLGDAEPLKEIGVVTDPNMNEEVEGAIQAEEEDISYGYNYGSSLENGESSISSESAEVHDGDTQVHEEEEDVSDEFDYVISLQDIDFSNSCESEAIAQTQEEKDEVSHLEGVSQTSTQLTDFEEFLASKKAIDRRIKELFARMDKSKEEHAIRMQRRRQFEMEAKINNLPEKRLNMAPTPSILDEDAIVETQEEEEENCHDSDVGGSQEENDISCDFDSMFSLQDDNFSDSCELEDILGAISKAQEEEGEEPCDVSIEGGNFVYTFYLEDTPKESIETLEDDNIFYDCNSEMEGGDDMLLVFDSGGSQEKEVDQQRFSETPLVMSLVIPPTTTQVWPESTGSMEFVNVNEEFHPWSMIWLILSLFLLVYYPKDSGFFSFTYFIILHVNAHLIFSMWEEEHEYTITDMETHKICEEMLLNVLLYEAIT
ncbi:hypothetical protein M5689_008022 [Euphorbia peplus]|nr:hypothetical protein M5689_008022 [Euphorbia peplus]